MWGLGDGATFTRRDLALAMALTIFERSVSDEHGMSLLLTTDERYAGHFRVTPQMPDLATEAQGYWRRVREKSKTEPQPGERWAIEFERPKE